MLRAKSIKPRCDIVLYANNLFILNCVKPKIAPIIKDKNELNNKPEVHVKLKTK